MTNFLKDNFKAKTKQIIADRIGNDDNNNISTKINGVEYYILMFGTLFDRKVLIECGFKVDQFDLDELLPKFLDRNDHDSHKQIIDYSIVSKYFNDRDISDFEKIRIEELDMNTDPNLDFR